ncbi:MAG: extracellular solute-binding protein [Candidatus Babeliales bacterium]
MKQAVKIRIVRYLIRMVYVSIVLFLMGVILTGRPEFLFFMKRSEQSINIISWANIIDPQLLSSFERETGIKVYLTYYETNEELYSKLLLTDGADYDLVIASDYVLERLIQLSMIKKYEAKNVFAVEELHPAMRSLYCDPHDEYVLPYSWTIIGLGIDTTFFGCSPPSTWKLIFDPHFIQHYSVGMTDDFREAILIAAQYTKGSIDSITPAVMETIVHTLKQQKSFVEMYSDSRAHELLMMRLSPVVVISTADMHLVEGKEFLFCVPREGAFINVEGIVLPKTTHKDSYAYAFIRYMYRPENIERGMEKYGYFSTLKTIKNTLLNGEVPEKMIPKLDFFRNVLDTERMKEVWLNILA